MDAIDTHELSLWREFNRQSPLGDERADLLAASLAAVVAQAAGAKVRVTDMLVRWDADDAQPSAEAGADALKAFLLSKVNKGS
ncbi:phage tail protein [Achromobacter xylosoxidans]